MSGRYAEFVENEVLAAGRSTGAREAHPRSRRRAPRWAAVRAGLVPYHGLVSPRALSSRAHVFGHLYKPAVAVEPEHRTAHGTYHENLIPKSRRKADSHLDGSRRSRPLNPNVMRDNMHDWVEANERMAKVLAAKTHHYQFVFAVMPGTSTAT